MTDLCYLNCQNVVQLTQRFEAVRGRSMAGYGWWNLNRHRQERWHKTKAGEAEL